MYDICTHFYKLLSTTSSVVSNEAKPRTESSKKLFTFLDNPEQAIAEFERTPSDEDEREIINTLKDSLNSIWSKNIGRDGLKSYLVSRVYKAFEDNTDVNKRFEPLNYLVIFTKTQTGVLKGEPSSGFYNKSKEFLTIESDEVNARKRDMIKEAINSCGLGEALTNNNLTMFFNKVSDFCKTLRQDYGDNELTKLIEPILNDSLFSFDSNLEVFEDTFKYTDVLKEKILNADITSTEYIIKHMEASGEPDDISLIKSVSMAISEFVVAEKEIKNMLLQKLSATFDKIETVKTRYGELYEKLVPLVKLRVSETLNDENPNPAVLNLALNTASRRVLVLDKYLLNVSYQAHIELMEHVMHLQHLSKIRTLLETISNLTK